MDQFNETTVKVVTLLFLWAFAYVYTLGEIRCCFCRECRKEHGYGRENVVGSLKSNLWVLFGVIVLAVVGLECAKKRVASTASTVSPYDLDAIGRERARSRDGK